MKKQGGIKQPYTFTGREYDAETGMYYYRARYYDPNSGRFISKDPIGFKGGDVNLYRYVGNNPINIIDPFGLHEVHFIPIYHTLKPTYDHLVITYDDKGIPVNISSGSIKPDPKQDNCKKGCPTIESRSYDFVRDDFPKTLKRADQTRYPALFIGTVPTTASNPNNNNTRSAKGVWIHKGYKDRTCAEGCLTIDPTDWEKFMKNFPKGSTGKVIVW